MTGAFFRSASAIRARLCRHLLRFLGEDGELRPVFGFPPCPFGGERLRRGEGSDLFAKKVRRTWLVSHEGEVALFPSG